MNNKRVIIVSGCHDCSYCDWDDSDEDSCFKLKYMCVKTFEITPRKITKSFKSKTLPDNCPLDNFVN